MINLATVPFKHYFNLYAFRLLHLGQHEGFRAGSQHLQGMTFATTTPCTLLSTVFLKTGLLPVLEHGNTGVVNYNIPLDGHSRKRTQYNEATMAHSINAHVDFARARKNDILTRQQPHLCSCSEVHLSPHAGCVRRAHVDWTVH
jgi:hypothetical protein